MTTRTVRKDQHGTVTGYGYGCRCEECTAANTAYGRTYHGWHAQSECVSSAGRNSRCGQIAARLIDTKAGVERVARLANRSAKHYAKYADELADAKIERAKAVQFRDEHMAECPGAADRFAA